MRQSTFVFVALPLLSTLNITALSVAYSHRFENNAILASGVISVAILCALVKVIGLVIHDIGPKRAALSLLVEALCMIVLFASVYHGFGLENPAPVIPSWTVAIYFSIVTWTTLGYGDFKPPVDICIIAALEAGMGYLYLGLIVGIITTMIGKKD